ncbi:MAG TPA: hypothetical protein DCY95_14875 [Algoriphagus sp.]|nr:hypothetical protein [Algoriphagus sp.]
MSFTQRKTKRYNALFIGQICPSKNEFIQVDDADGFRMLHFFEKNLETIRKIRKPESLLTVSFSVRYAMVKRRKDFRFILNYFKK